MGENLRWLQQIHTHPCWREDPANDSWFVGDPPYAVMRGSRIRTFRRNKWIETYTEGLREYVRLTSDGIAALEPKGNS